MHWSSQIWKVYALIQIQTDVSNIMSFLPPWILTEERLCSHTSRAIQKEYYLVPKRRMIQSCLFALVVMLVLPTRHLRTQSFVLLPSTFFCLSRFPKKGWKWEILPPSASSFVQKRDVWFFEGMYLDDGMYVSRRFERFTKKKIEKISVRLLASGPQSVWAVFVWFLVLILKERL